MKKYLNAWSIALAIAEQNWACVVKPLPETQIVQKRENIIIFMFIMFN